MWKIVLYLMPIIWVLYLFSYLSVACKSIQMLLLLDAALASGSSLLLTLPLAVLGTSFMKEIPPASHLCGEQRS